MKPLSSNLLYTILIKMGKEKWKVVPTIFYILMYVPGVNTKRSTKVTCRHMIFYSF